LDKKARALEPRFRRAFFDALDRVRQSIDEQELQQALERGPQVAIRYVEEQVSEQQFQGFAETFAASSAVGATAILAFLGVDKDPADLDGITRQQYVSQIVSELRRNTIEGARQALLREDATAEQLVSKIGLTPRQEQAVENYRRMLEDGDRDAFRRDLRDRRFDASVRRAVDGEQLSQDKIDRMVERYRERYKKHRAQTIARTESIRAVHAGQQNEIEDLIQRGEINPREVRLYWRHQNDSRVRDSHLAIPRQNPEGVAPGQAFQSPQGPIRYPGDPLTPPSNHVNCRCLIIPRAVNG
jgi:hypothetical protein